MQYNCVWRPCLTAAHVAKSLFSCICFDEPNWRELQPLHAWTCKPMCSSTGLQVNVSC